MSIRILTTGIPAVRHQTRGMRTADCGWSLQWSHCQAGPLTGRMRFPKCTEEVSGAAAAYARQKAERKVEERIAAAEAQAREAEPVREQRPEKLQQ